MSEWKCAKTAELQCYIVKEVDRQEYEEQYPDDTALLRQALTQMERHHPTVADAAPHVDVMAYNATITALRERLGVKT